MEKEKRFNVGDKVTYKNQDDCPKGKYRYGGINQGGYVGTIQEYSEYQEEYSCWRIEVSSNGESALSSYSMLEDEFIEYDASPDPYNGFKVGDSVKTYKFEETPDLGFSDAMYKHCGEVGVISAFHMEESGLQAYVHGWYWPISAINLIERSGENVFPLPNKFDIGDTVNTTNKGYQYVNMGSNAHDCHYTWKVITVDCNVLSDNKSNVIIKDKVYSKCQDKWWYKFDYTSNWISECGVEAIGKPVDPLEALLEEAIRRYPIGTKIRPLHTDGSLFQSECVVTRTPSIVGGGVEAGYGYVYKEGEWALILTDSSNPCGEIPLTTSNGTYTGFSGSSTMAFSGSTTASTFAEIRASLFPDSYHTGKYYGGIDPVQLVPNKVDNVPHQEPKILRHKEKRRKLVIVNQ